jgi:hypothetical protein
VQSNRTGTADVVEIDAAMRQPLAVPTTGDGYNLMFVSAYRGEMFHFVHCHVTCLCGLQGRDRGHGEPVIRTGVKAVCQS